MGAGMDAIDAFTTASESYGDWENVAVAVLAIGLPMGGLI